MEKCWANSLGDCGRGLTREHLVSRCVFPDRLLTVSGLDFCKTTHKQIHINKLTAKILCGVHNNRLGEEVDPVGGELFGALRLFAQRQIDQADFPKLKWVPIEYRIDSRKLERWLLKTMLGMSFGHAIIIGPGKLDTGQVPAELVRIAFGLEQFTHGRGLYVAFKGNETFTLEDRFHYTGKLIGKNLLLGHFSIHGLRFYLNLEAAGDAIFRTIENSQVFYREAHFVQLPAINGRDRISSSFRGDSLFTQKLSIS